MKKPDLLVLVAVWDFFLAFATFVGLLAIAIFAFPAVINSQVGTALAGAIFGLSVAVLLLVVMLVVSFFGTIGLLSGKEWGRLCSIVIAALSLISIPIGTAIGIMILIYLTRAEVRDYFAAGQK